MDIGSLYSDYLTSTQDMTGLSSTISNTDYSKATDDELMDVCKQFEAYFLEQVFKEMEKTIPESESSSSSTSTLTDYFKGTALQSITADATKQNSLGLAQMLYEQMKRNYEV